MIIKNDYFLFLFYAIMEMNPLNKVKCCKIIE